jgi:hypothetical protein
LRRWSAISAKQYTFARPVRKKRSAAAESLDIIDPGTGASL